MDILVRAERDPGGVTELARRKVHGIDPELPVRDPLPLSVYVSRANAQLRFTLILGTIVGAIALLLSAIALYGVISYTVSRRAREFGIRMALARGLSNMLYGVSATDPLTFIVIPGFLTAVALLACYFPARRATRVDPIAALRCD